jgi:hypothetical protein
VDEPREVGDDGGDDVAEHGRILLPVLSSVVFGVQAM